MARAAELSALIRVSGVVLPLLWGSACGAAAPLSAAFPGDEGGEGGDLGDGDGSADGERDGNGDDGMGDDGTGDGERPQSRAGDYVATSVESTVASGSFRSSAVAWNGERWIMAFIGVTDHHRTYVSTAEPSGNGLSIGPVQRLDDGDYDSFEAELAVDDSGRALAVYEDDRVGAGTCCREIYARFLDTSGNPTGEGFDLTNRPSTEEYLPSVAWESGTWLVAWSDDRQYAGDDRRLLYTRTVGDDGALGEERAIGPDSLWQVFSNVTGSGGEGHFLVTWGDYDPVNGGLDCGYRARVLGTDGAPTTGVIEIARIGNQVYDRPAAAWSPWKGAWLVAWMTPYHIEGTWVFPDGTREDLGVLVDEEVGAGAARLSWSAATDSFALGWHAWWTTEGFVTMLDGEGVPATDAMRVTAAAPPLGTFYVPVAADDEGTVLAAPQLDYSRIVGSVFAPG
jgi:hypothetical protein